MLLLQEEERLRKEEEEHLRKEEEERLLREAEEKRLEEARLAELAQKADKDRRKAEEEERLRKASEESEKNQVDINMAEDCEWSRLSPLSTSWFLLSLAAEHAEVSEQPKASGSRVRSRTPGKNIRLRMWVNCPFPVTRVRRKARRANVLGLGKFSSLFLLSCLADLSLEKVQRATLASHIRLNALRLRKARRTRNLGGKRPRMSTPASERLRSLTGWRSCSS